MLDLNRAKVLDHQFCEQVSTQKFPDHSFNSEQIGHLDKSALQTIFKSQLISRLLDIVARELKETGASFYTIGSSGHEGMAAVAQSLRTTDPAFLHYRDAAFFIQRALMEGQVDPVMAMLLSFVASSKDPISAGRHKVLGSIPLNIPPQTSTIASHIPKAVGAAFSIRRAKELNLTANFAANSVIICSFGDASFNHSTCQGGLNAARWICQHHCPLPIIFVCEDNNIGISVPTPKHWVQSVMQDDPYIHYLSANGLDIVDVYTQTKQAEKIARQSQQPVFLHLKMVRLLGHAGSDIEQHYRSEQAIKASEAQDPLLFTAKLLIEQNIYTAKEIVQLYQQLGQQIRAQALSAQQQPKLNSAQQIMQSIIPQQLNKKTVKPATIAKRKACFAKEFPQLKIPRNLCQNINYALTDLMLTYPEILVFGEDVAVKGGVYRVTAELMKRFGRRRVFDTLLDEQTILGHAIGLAQNGFLPIPEIQFLAYLHNAEDQLRGEAATLSFFSNAQLSNPMVIRIASWAYQRGFGGHFHNDNSIAVLRDIPGIIIACPSNGSDAAKLLRECVNLAYHQQRIVVFLEPIALYMTKDLHQANDNAWLSLYPPTKDKIALGEVSTHGTGQDCLIISFANGYYLSRQAQAVLAEQYDCHTTVVDLHWLAPLPIEPLLEILPNFQSVLIVDESRKTGSVSETLITQLYEQVKSLPHIERLTGADCFIPLGNAWQYVLPSKDDIIENVLKICHKMPSTI